jgi:hypothetical protein
MATQVPSFAYLVGRHDFRKSFRPVVAKTAMETR